jgi:Tol biopolymer transport system component
VITENCQFSILSFGGLVFVSKPSLRLNLLYNTLVTFRIRRPHPSKKQILAILVPPALVVATVVAIFFGKGYQININGRVVDKTGMLVVKSQPDGGKIFLDGEWKSATPNTFSNLRPKTYLLRVEKQGYGTWEKQVNVYPELVTDITAVLVSITPKLEPLTIGGANHPVYNEATHTIAYTTTNNKTGIWVLPIGRPLPITLFQSAPTLVMPDSESTQYSQATNLVWSPDGSEILAQIGPKDYRLIDISQSKELQKATTPEEITKDWQATQTKKRLAFLESLTITPELARTATASGTRWSPDERKFTYQKDNGDGTASVIVHNMESPIPVDEKTDYTVITAAKDKLPPLVWYQDSYHFVIKDSGSLYLLRIDGTNKTEIYSGAMEDDIFFMTPDGNKVVISASFKKDVPPELYAVSLR